MKAGFIFFTYVFIMVLSISSCGNDDHYSIQENDEFEMKNYVLKADSQLRYMVFCLDTIKEKDESLIIPIYFDDNELVLGSAFDWRSGFFPGCCWLMYELTDNDYWESIAQKYTWMIKDAASYSQHDLGFMFNCSFGRAFSITGDESYRNVLVKAAQTLAGRYNENIGCIQSWGASKKWHFPVIIDAMMNLELLFEATKITGDSTFYKIGVSHANKTLENHFREDYSSYHVVSYKDNGEVECKKTSQGYSDDSSWSRGQAWGLYGFTMCYRYTNDKKYLNLACHIADYLLSLDYGYDYIPYWDMSVPDIPNTPKDASSASIMSSALVELSEYVGGGKSEQYLEYAKRQMMSLYHNYTCSYKSTCGFLLDHSVGSYPTNDQVDVPSIYADYYYLEALLKIYNRSHSNNNN